MPARENLHSKMPFLPPPLPGTELPRRALFVARSGALFSSDMPATRAQFDPAFFSRDAVSLLFRAQHCGWALYLIGNEDGVARGRVSDSAWERFEAGMLAHLKGQGIRIARNYACLDHPRGKGKHRRDSVFLLPNTGALYHAAQEDGIDLSESWLIGTSALELAAGWRSGVRIAAVAAQRQARAGEIEVEAALCALELAQVVREILAQDSLTRA